MPSGLKALLRLFRAPELHTYEESRDALGGAPWQRLDSTESWFKTHDPGPTGRTDPTKPFTTPGDLVVPKPPALDAAAYRLERPSLAEKLRRRPALLIACAMGVVAFGSLAVAVSVTSTSGSPLPVTAVVLPATSPPAPRPVVTTSPQQQLPRPPPARPAHAAVPDWLVSGSTLAAPSVRRVGTHTRKVHRTSAHRKHRRRA